MRLLAFIFILCASNAYIIRAFAHETPEEKIERIKKHDAEVDAFYAKERAKMEVKVGDSKERIRSLWGDPSETEHPVGIDVWRYSNDDKPIVFSFRDEKLESWVYDREAEARIRKHKEEIRASRKPELTGGQKAGMVLKAFGDGFNRARSRQVNCQSYVDGNYVNTTCN